MIKVTPEELAVIAKYVNEITGIMLDQSKAYLIESRIGPLVEELGCKNYSELYFRSKSDTTRTIQKRIIDAITTNETFFFRDSAPFELIKFKVIPDLIDKINLPGGIPRNSLSIWSAACSTGQEVYSIAIILKELLPDFEKWRIRFVGTDISDAAVAQASYGKYNRAEIERGLSEQQRFKYFSQGDNCWRIKDEIRSMAMFKKMNLLEPFVGIQRFDMILCRNVAIYFSPQNRKTMFERIANQLNPHGVLIIGASESLIGISDRFNRREYHNSVFYELIT